MRVRLLPLHLRDRRPCLRLRPCARKRQRECLSYRGVIGPLRGGLTQVSARGLEVAAFQCIEAEPAQRFEVAAVEAQYGRPLIDRALAFAGFQIQAG